MTTTSSWRPMASSAAATSSSAMATAIWPAPPPRSCNSQKKKRPMVIKQAKNWAQPPSCIANAPSAPVDADFQPSFYDPHHVKHRRRISPEQCHVLETEYGMDTKPNATKRHLLAEKLGMTPRAIQIWFQNKRAKQKQKSQQRMAQQAHLHALDASTCSGQTTLASPMASPKPPTSPVIMCAPDMHVSLSSSSSFSSISSSMAHQAIQTSQKDANLTNADPNRYLSAPLTPLPSPRNSTFLLPASTSTLPDLEMPIYATSSAFYAPSHEACSSMLTASPSADSLLLSGPSTPVAPPQQPFYHQETANAWPLLPAAAIYEPLAPPLVSQDQHTKQPGQASMAAPDVSFDMNVLDVWLQMAVELPDVTFDVPMYRYIS